MKLKMSVGLSLMAQWLSLAKQGVAFFKTLNLQNRANCLVEISYFYVKKNSGKHEGVRIFEIKISSFGENCIFVLKSKNRMFGNTANENQYIFRKYQDLAKIQYFPKTKAVPLGNGTNYGKSHLNLLVYLQYVHFLKCSITGTITLNQIQKPHTVNLDQMFGTQRCLKKNKQQIDSISPLRVLTLPNSKNATLSEISMCACTVSLKMFCMLVQPLEVTRSVQESFLMKKNTTNLALTERYGIQTTFP